MYEEYHIYGPYLRKDGRQHVVLRHKETKKLKTVSYPKFLLENKIGRYLHDHETCDHIDEDHTNNSLDNLQPLSRLDNAIKGAEKSYKGNYIKFCKECREPTFGKRKYGIHFFCSSQCRMNYYRPRLYPNWQRKEI